MRIEPSHTPLRGMLLVLSGLLFLSASHQAAGETMTRASLNPADTAWVGQRVRFHLDVLSSEGWAKIESEPMIEVPGAHVIRTESQGTRLNETIGGNAYSGQQYEYSIFPRRAGLLVVPSLTVEVAVQSYGAKAAAGSKPLQTEALKLPVTLPAGATAGADLASTTELTASQTWDPTELSGLKVGDAIKRSIELVAEEVSAMALPPPPLPDIEGAKVYAAQPQLDDAADRGALKGTRVDRITYMLEQPGSVTLPDVVVEWFDLRTKTLKRETLVGAALEVKPGPMTPATASHRNRSGRTVTLIAALAALGLGAFWFLRKRSGKRKARAPTERELFRRFRHQATSGSAIDDYRALFGWLDSIADGTPRLDRFVAQYGDDRSAQLVDGLAAAALDPRESAKPSPRSAELYRAMRQARRSQRKAARQRVAADALLPPLNP